MTWLTCGSPQRFDARPALAVGKYDLDVLRRMSRKIEVKTVLRAVVFPDPVVPDKTP